MSRNKAKRQKKAKKDFKPVELKKKRNTRTETFRGKKMSEKSVSEREKMLAHGLRFYPVEFVTESELLMPTLDTRANETKELEKIELIDVETAIDSATTEVLPAQPVESESDLHSVSEINTPESSTDCVPEIDLSAEPEEVNGGFEVDIDEPVPEPDEAEIEEDTPETGPAEPEINFSVEPEETDLPLESDKTKSDSESIESDFDFFVEREIDVSQLDISDSDGPVITLDDYEDCNSSDNMSELDDEQIFALASGTSVYEHEDRDIFDKYDDYDEYFDELIHSGVSDRKKQKRQIREAMHAAKFGKEPQLWKDYPDSITVHEILDEIRKFGTARSIDNVSFPPLDSNANWYVASLAEAHGMKAVTIGKDTRKYVKAIRTKRTNPFVHESKLKKFLTRRQTFLRTDTEVKKKDKKASKPSQRVRDGDVVGQHATEIDETNFGHQLLKQMGWQQGSGLGNGGIVAPIPATVKLTRVGLGHTQSN